MLPIRSSVGHFAILAGLVLAGCSRSQRITAPDSSGTVPGASRAGIAADASRASPQQGSEFVPRSDNPYFPLVPGTTFYYRSRTPDGIETQEVRVTRETKKVMGVTTLVVKDVVRLDGEVIERTSDYFAMDELGNVWYFGEDSRSFDPETGEVSTDGSWLAGRDGAQAGIIMEAHPKVGDAYNEENAPGVAQDKARVLALDAEAKVRRGRFDDCLQTENTTPLEPDALENKFYAPGVGLVLEIDVAGDGVRNELVRVTRSRSDDDREGDDDRGHISHRGGDGGAPRGSESD
jgi:hypothetical protein